MADEKEKEAAAVAEEQGQPKEFDDILGAIGEFGRWQKILFCLVSLIGIMTAMNTLAQVFMAGEADHWCRVAPWDQANCTDTGPPDDWECLLEKRNASIPLVTNNKSDKAFEQCEMYDIGEKPFILGANSSFYETSNTIKCADADGWVYDTRQYQTTIINEKSFVSLAQSIYFAGLLVGSFVFGSLADLLGRKPTIYIATTLFLAATLGNVFSPSIVVYMVLRFFVAAGGMGAYLIAYVLGKPF
ncbi:solute carrier family 22 member 6-B-like [Acanthaster planci]|uniref:Solute carrier family 22 member 6-B-like n=1 Tax=Acanthaster planci TaxID=133434 RepID=A0A8B7ZZA8_ACAPL|nr:solute carrier family 22 member 6-B-like [Acanthaster planci]